MQDDFTVFWRNNARAYDFFQDLLARAKKDAYDDDFLAQLAAYREAMGNTVHADIFAAQYLLAYGDAETALVCGERAYAKRPVNYEVWKVLAAAYKGVGRELDALTMQGHIQGLYPMEDISLTLPKKEINEALKRFSLAANTCNSAPMLSSRTYLENGTLHFRPDTFLGEEIPLMERAGVPRLWAGLFVDEGFLSTKGMVYEKMRHDHFFMINDRDVTFDLQRVSTVTGQHRIELSDGVPVALPVAGTKFAQGFAIKDSSGEHIGHLGKYAFSYFRLNESVTLRSEDGVPYAVGTPIPLRHSPALKKLVLNILVDGLCRPATDGLFSVHMPRIARFFSQGTIFDQHFSASEYTLPSLPSIETGFYAHHTHVFNERDSHEMPHTLLTLAEQMKSLGYYCTAPMATGQCCYYGTYRGYDRLISSYGFLPAYEGVERTLRTLEAFPETDHFMLLHITDVHPLNIQTPLKFSTAAELSVPLADRFVPLDPTVPSVRTPHLPIYLEQFRISLAHIDRTLGHLLSYIEERYDTDEYIVNLYSDHGCSIFDPNTRGRAVDVIGTYATGAAWMMRGAGVPAGIVADELTSSVDIYPTLGHLCGFHISGDIDGNLPAVFGGAARDAVYSASQFPGQTFKLAVRSATHTLRVETQGFTQEDGTADFAGATARIYPRGHELEDDYAVDSEELRRFFYPRARDFVREIANNGEVFG